MRDQWEHKLLIGHWPWQDLRDAEGVSYGRLSQELLNRLGHEGWELCSESFSFVSPRIVILKRKIPAGQEAGPLASAQEAARRAPAV
jgi:hypothetical protein